MRSTGGRYTCSPMRCRVRARPLLFRRCAHSHGAALDASLLPGPLAAGGQQTTARGRAAAVMLVVVCGGVDHSDAAGRAFCWNSQMVDAMLLFLDRTQRTSGGVRAGAVAQHGIFTPAIGGWVLIIVPPDTLFPDGLGGGGGH